MKKIILFLFFLFVSYICYAQLFHHGFIFEEWQKYAEVRVQGSIIPQEYFQYSPIDIFLAKGRPLGTMVNNILLLSFSNNPAPYAVVAIIGHALNAFLLFLIARTLFANNIVALVSSLVFLTIPISREALSYFAATIETVYSQMFYLLSFYAALYFRQTRKMAQWFLSLFFLYLSIQFKQASSFFVIVLVAFLYEKMAREKKSISRIVLVLSLAMFFAIVGIVGFSRYSQWYNDLYGSGGFAPIVSIENALIYPIVTVPHFFVPERFLVRLGTRYVMSHFPVLGWIPSYVYDFIYSSFAVDIISLFIAIPIWICVALAFSYCRKKRLTGFLIALYCMSFIPIAVAQQQRASGFLESRYYYGVVPAFVLLMVYVTQIWLSLRKSIATLLMVVFILFVAKNISLIHRELVDTLVVSSDMRNKVSQILAAHPDIPQNPIFYFEGGQDLFNHFGTGYMLALQYPDSAKIPRSLFLLAKTDSPVYWEKGIGKKDFEGYLTEGDRAVGFFYKKASLKQFLRTHPDISPKQVVGFGFNEDNSIRAETYEP